MYRDGHGDTRNYQEARRLFALASAQRYTDATKRLKQLEEKIHAECPLLGNQVVVTRTSRRNLNGKAGAAVCVLQPRPGSLCGGFGIAAIAIAGR